MRKARPTGPLNTLPLEKRVILHGWLAENLTLPQIVARLKAEMGITTSETSVGNYYQRWGRGLLIAHAQSRSAGTEVCPLCGSLVQLP